MDPLPSPCSPKLASKIPRRRPSTQLSSHPPPQPPISPTKLSHSSQYATSPPPSSQPPLSAHNTWPPPPSSSQTLSQSQSQSNSMIQDRRRTRTRTRTTESTDPIPTRDYPNSPPTHSHSHSHSHSPSRASLPTPQDPRFPPLSIHIPSSSHSPSRTRSISNTHSSKPSPTSNVSYSFTPRTRQPSLPYSSLRTSKPPMSERPRIPSTTLDHKRTTTSSSTANLATPATYESFDFPIPATPDEEREELRLLREWEEERRARFCGLGRMFIGSSRREERVIIGERTRLLGLGEEKEMGRWEYVWGEVKCYAKHMLPPVILFVLIALSLALFIYNKEVGRIVRGRFPNQEEEP